MVRVLVFWCFGYGFISHTCEGGNPTRSWLAARLVASWHIVTGQFYTSGLAQARECPRGVSKGGAQALWSRVSQLLISSYLSLSFRQRSRVHPADDKLEMCEVAVKFQ